MNDVLCLSVVITFGVDWHLLIHNSIFLSQLAKLVMKVSASMNIGRIAPFVQSALSLCSMSVDFSWRMTMIESAVSLVSSTFVLSRQRSLMSKHKKVLLDKWLLQKTRMSLFLLKTREPCDQLSFRRSSIKHGSVVFWCCWSRCMW